MTMASDRTSRTPTATFRSRVAAEIATLKARSAQLNPSKSDLDSQLEALRGLVSEARGAANAALVERLLRKVAGIERSRAQVDSEIRMLTQLIDARLDRYGMRPDGETGTLARVGVEEGFIPAK